LSFNFAKDYFTSEDALFSVFYHFYINVITKKKNNNHDTERSEPEDVKSIVGEEKVSGIIIQGAPDSLHETPEFKIYVVQQPSDPPSLRLQPVPPHTPQDSMQQMTELFSP
jgi:hypothetical protein